jgi:hypothetical protein
METKMESKVFTACILAAYFFSCASFGLDGSGDITAEVKIYSGRTAPKWVMSSDEVEELGSRLSRLSGIEPPKIIPSYGYVEILNPSRNPSLPYFAVYVFALDGIVIVDDGVTRSFLAGDSGLMEWLIALGDKHDPNYGTLLYKTLPPGTPHIEVIPSSINGSASPGTIIQRKLTIFSEGNAPLIGSFEAPDYVTVEPGEIQLQAISGIKDYMVSIDAGGGGVREGSILIKSNDPTKKEYAIPYRIVVADGPADGPAPMQNSGIGLPEMAAAGIILLILCILYIFYRRRNKSKASEKGMKEGST